MKRMEEEREKRGEVGGEGRKVASFSVGKSNQVHPGEEQGVTPNKVNPA